MSAFAKALRAVFLILAVLSYILAIQKGVGHDYAWALGAALIGLFCWFAGLSNSLARS